MIKTLMHACIVDGKIVERETVYDLIDLYRQLGVIEYKELQEDVS